MNVLRKNFWVFGIGVALGLALLFAIVFALLSWLENPNGIFHDAAGTNWDFVYETAASWFVPTFLYTFVVASIGHLLASRFSVSRAQRNGSNVDRDSQTQ